MGLKEGIYNYEREELLMQRGWNLRALRKKTQKDWIVFFVLFLFIVSGSVYYIYFFTPKNSLELYQKLHFSDSFEQAQKLILDGYEDYFSEEDFNYIQKHSADSLGQFTLFEYKKKLI